MTASVPILIASLCILLCSTFSVGYHIVAPTKIKAQMGFTGTDDDVSLTLCSDVFGDMCCSTPRLNSAWTNDWSREDEEEWGGREWLGDCAGKAFTLEQGFKVTLNLHGGDNLYVERLEVRSETSRGEKRRFSCGPFYVTNLRRQDEKLCAR